ncbi:hypothetical protein D3C85_1433440 [compost metagenome]
MFKTVSVPTGISNVFIPIYEITKTELAEGTNKRKFPLTSVRAPPLVPFTATEAPPIGTPLSSLTTPLTSFC